MLGPAGTGSELLAERADRLAEVTDLDAPSADPEVGAPGVEEGGPEDRGARLARWPDRTPGWARGPLGVAAAVAVTALVTALVATGAAERQQLAERRATVRLLAMMAWPERQVGSPEEPIDLQLVVLNAGPEPVRVSGVRLDGSTSELHLDEPVTVEPGASAAVPAALELDCGRTTEPGTLVLTAEPRGGSSTEVPAGDIGRGLGMTPRDALTFCTAHRVEEIPVWRTSAEADGALVLHVRNIHAHDVVLDVTSPPGTAVRGDPELPARLPARRSVLLRLHLDVQRCTSAAQRADAGGQVEFSVDDEVGAINPDGLTVAGWFARRVAQDCG